MTIASDLVQLRRATPDEYRELIDRPIDNTALAAYMRCPKLFDYSMRQHRRSEGRTKPALAYGSAIHVGIETLLKIGTNERAQEMGFIDLATAAGWKMSEKWQDHDSPDDYRTLDRAIRDIGKYLQHYGEPGRLNARVIGWPEAPMVEISTEVLLPGCDYPYAVKIDDIFAQSPGVNYVEDHKTTSQFGATFFNQFQLKNQMVGYATVAQELLGQPILGVRINAVIARKTGTDFQRQTIPFSQDFIKGWKANYNVWIARIAQDCLTEKLLRDSGVDDITIDTLAFPRNFDGCDGKYGMCQYTSVCAMPPKIRLRSLEQDYPNPTPWNPLEAEDDE